MGTVNVTEELIKVNQEYKNRDEQIQEWLEKQHTFFLERFLIVLLHDTAMRDMFAIFF
jgi:hypothetical protein